MKQASDYNFQDYLDRVEEAARYLPDPHRFELIRSIEEHLHEAERSGLSDRPELAREVLRKLGTPEAIVEAAGEEVGVAIHRDRKPRISIETKAFLLLTLGSLIPVLGWVWGVSVVWGSERWRRREKWAAALLIPGGPLAALVLGGWISTLTVVACQSGFSGTTEGLGGAPIGSPTLDPVICSQPAITPWIGLVIVVLALAASIAGPAIVRHNIIRRAPSGVD